MVFEKKKKKKKTLLDKGGQIKHRFPEIEAR